MATVRTLVAVDWLAFTRTEAEMSNPLSAHRYCSAFGLSRPEYVQVKPRHGYSKAIRYPKTGTICLYDGAPGMGTHVILPGDACKRDNGYKVMARALEADCRISRLDIAFDVFDGNISLEALARAIKNGTAETKSRKWSEVKGTTGHTIYVGSRSSEKYLRIYDKAAEQGVDGQWVRFELELKGATANTVARALLANGLESIPAIIAGYCAFPDIKAWRDAFATYPTSVDIEPTRRKLTDTEKWLEETVAPALARIVHGDPAYWLTFKNEVDKHVRSLDSK